MKTLRSYIRGDWHEAQSGLVPLVNPSTEETIAQAAFSANPQTGKLKALMWTATPWRGTRMCRP